MKEPTKEFVKRMKSTKKVPPSEQDAARLRKISIEDSLNRIVKKAKASSKKK
jgi:hypothetical protein